jgi:hypothetical protein
MLLGWLLGIKSPSGHVFNRASDGLFLLAVLLVVVPCFRRPKFIREFFYGPERELSDDEKAAEARNKKLETLKRPVSWAFSISFDTFLLTAILWYLGEVGTTTGLAIALVALAIMQGSAFGGNIGSPSIFATTNDARCLRADARRPARPGIHPALAAGRGDAKLSHN